MSKLFTKTLKTKSTDGILVVVHHTENLSLCMLYRVIKSMLIMKHLIYSIIYLIIYRIWLQRKITAEI